MGVLMAEPSKTTYYGSAEIHMKENAKSTVLKPRSLPLALQPLVKKKMDGLGVERNRKALDPTIIPIEWV
ncbi:hypothetical protein J6590_067603 [Homalodisca vitripennis]|nr:hypothetical protein J6590_067603 [Homalodisca vitripennis]